MFSPPQPNWIYAISQIQVVLSVSVPLPMLFIKSAEIFSQRICDSQLWPVVQNRENVNNYFPILRQFHLASFYSTANTYLDLFPFFPVCPLNIIHIIAKEYYAF